MAYEKHTWTAPELITKEKLNNIEDGISEAIAKAAEAADGVFVQTALSVSVNDENRAVMYNSGITVSISGYNASDYVDISGWYAVMYKQIKIPYNANTGIAFYSDADEQNYLSGVNCAVNRDSLGYVGLDIAIVPEGAKYVRFTMLPTDTYGAFEAYGVTHGFCELNEKQDKLTFDDSPTASSDNPVKSGGIKSQLDILSQNMRDFYDSAMDAVRNSEMTLNLELSQKQDTLTFDATPTAGSNNPVKSSGIKTAIDNLGTEVDDLKSAINSVAGYYSDEESITLNTGAIMVTSSTGTVASLTPDTTQTSYKYALVECKYLDKAIITGQGGSIRLYAFIDSNNVILAAATANQVNRDLELIAPQNTAYLIYNSKLGDMSKVDYYEYNSGSITDLQNDIDELKIEENSIWE